MFGSRVGDSREKMALVSLDGVSRGRRARAAGSGCSSNAHRSQLVEEGKTMAAAKTSVKSAPKSAGGKPKARGAEQRYHVARRASILLKHVSDPTRLQVILILCRRRAARRRLVLPAEPEPARRQPSPGTPAARRHHRPAPPGQEQLLQPDRHRLRPGQGRQEPDRLSSPRSANQSIPIWVNMNRRWSVRSAGPVPVGTA